MPARELVRLTKESLDLARALGEPNILDIAESAAGSNCARLKRRQLSCDKIVTDNALIFLKPFHYP